MKKQTALNNKFLAGVKSAMNFKVYAKTTLTYNAQGEKAALEYVQSFFNKPIDFAFFENFATQKLLKVTEPTIPVPAPKTGFAADQEIASAYNYWTSEHMTEALKQITEAQEELKNGNGWGRLALENAENALLLALASVAKLKAIKVEGSN